MPLCHALSWALHTFRQTHNVKLAPTTCAPYFTHAQPKKSSARPPKSASNKKERSAPHLLAPPPHTCCTTTRTCCTTTSHLLHHYHTLASPPRAPRTCNPTTPHHTTPHLSRMSVLTQRLARERIEEETRNTMPQVRVRVRARVT